MRKSFAVIPTRNRPREFARCVEAIRPQVDAIVAVCHGSDAFNYAAEADHRIGYMVHGRANISRMWNLGIDYARQHRGDVAVLNDDAIPAPTWFATVRDQMLAADAFGASERRHRGSDKIAGWAFVLNGAYLLRADEQFAHWFGDDDLQRQAGERWLLIDGVETPNTRANSTSRSADARAQIELDAAAYSRKWGLG